MQVVVIGAGRMGAIRAVDLSADPRVTDVVIVNRTPDRAASLARELGATAVAWEDLSTLRPDRLRCVHGRDLGAGDPANEVEVVHMHVAEDPAAARDELARRRRVVVGGHHHRVEDSEPAGDDQVAGATDAGIESPLEADLNRGAVTLRAGDDLVGVLQRESDRLLAEHGYPLLQQAREQVRVRIGGESRDEGIRAQHQYAEFDDADATQIQLVTVDGIQVSISGTRHDPLGHDVRMEIFGSADSVVAGLNPRTPLHSLDGDADPSASLGMNDRPYTGFVDRFREAFRVETAAFVSMVAGEAANACPPDAARESLRIAIACEESVRRGGVVHVADIGPEHRPPP